MGWIIKDDKNVVIENDKYSNHNNNNKNSHSSTTKTNIVISVSMSCILEF